MAIRHCFYVFICIFADVARISVFVANVAWVCNMCNMLHMLHTNGLQTSCTCNMCNMLHATYLPIFSIVAHSCNMNYRHSLILHLKCKWITINFLLQLGWSCNRFELQPWMLFDVFTIYRSLADIELLKGICVK